MAEVPSGGDGHGGVGVVFKPQGRRRGLKDRREPQRENFFSRRPRTGRADLGHSPKKCKSSQEEFVSNELLEFIGNLLEFIGN